MKAGLKTVTSGYEIMGGEVSNLVFVTTEKFRAANPKVSRHGLDNALGLRPKGGAGAPLWRRCVAPDRVAATGESERESDGHHHAPHQINPASGLDGSA